MENNTKYHFLGETYDNVSDFTLALANNYADALNFIYQDEFIDLFTDSYLKGRILAERERSYYATSALASIIYILNPNLGLILNGASLKSYEDIVDALDDEFLRISVIHLFKDHTISHTFGRINKSIPYLFDIENNIDDQGVVAYLQLLFDNRLKEEDIHGYKVLDYYLFKTLGAKDPFGEYLKLLYSPEFKGILAHRYGLSLILDLYKKPSYEYEILEKISEEMSLNVNPIIISGMHNYFFNNIKYLKNYKIRKYAKKIKNKAKKAGKKAKKDITFTLNCSRIYFELYRFVLASHKLGLILPKVNNYDLSIKYDYQVVNKDYLISLSYKNECEEIENVILPKDSFKVQYKEFKKQLKDYLKHTYKDYFKKME